MAIETTVEPAPAETTGDAHGAALLRRYATAGDRDAFEGFMRLHAEFVHGLCLRYLRHASDAEDAAQATFIICLQRAWRFRDGTAPRPWLAAIALNTCRDRVRRDQRRARAHRASPLPLQPAATPADEGIEDLLRALEQLPAEDRALIWLRFRDGLTVREAAAAMGLREKAADSRLRRAMAVLAERMRVSLSAVPVLLVRPITGEALAVNAAAYGRVAETIITRLAATGMARLMPGWRTCGAAIAATIAAMALMGAASSEALAPAPDPDTAIARILPRSTDSGNGNDASWAAPHGSAEVSDPTATTTTPTLRERMELETCTVTVWAKREGLGALGLDARTGIQRVDVTAARSLMATYQPAYDAGRETSSTIPPLMGSGEIQVTSSGIAGNGDSRQSLDDLVASLRPLFDQDESGCRPMYAVISVAPAADEGGFTTAISLVGSISGGIGIDARDSALDGAIVLFCDGGGASPVAQAIAASHPQRAVHAADLGEVIAVPLGAKPAGGAADSFVAYELLWAEADHGRLDSMVPPRGDG